MSAFTTGSLSSENIGMIFPDGTEAVRDVSFRVDRSGHVRVSRDSPGYVFQNAALLPWRTVRGNVELFAELHGFDRNRRRRLARQTIDLVGLKGFENHYPRSLSGGMKMRASLARSLTLSPLSSCSTSRSARSTR